MSETVTIPKAEYERLLDVASDLDDIAIFDRVRADLVSGKEEALPEEFALRLIEGESPLKVYRNLGGMTQAALSNATGVNRVQITDIEAGRSQGSIGTVRKLAETLSVTIDDLVWKTHERQQQPRNKDPWKANLSSTVGRHCPSKQHALLFGKK